MRARLLATLLVALGSGCVTGRTLEMDPVLVTVNEEDLALSRLNEEELFACGSAAYQAQDFPRAVKCFTRLADTFPSGPRWKDAQYNAGVAYEQLGEFLLALERYRTVMDPVRGQGDALDATWRAASCHYHLGDYEGAVALLEQVAARGDVTSTDRIHALTHIGVCHVESGKLSEAEGRLREALAIYKDRSEVERLDDYFPCQAQFFLGELYRLHFLAVKLVAVDDPNKLGNELEYKAQLLLSAQGHYLRAIRMGNPHWGVAAGQRIGSLYEGFYDEMTTAPVPQTLDEEQAALYRATLRKRVRVLVHKAISIYERTISAAERVGVNGGFLEATKGSLDRMKQVLLADAARDEEPAVDDGAPPSAAEVDPDEPAAPPVSAAPDEVRGVSRAAAP